MEVFMKLEKGCIHIYCGDGKGKTTASLGLALRASGNGLKVLIVQFLKGQPTGELTTLALIPNISVIRIPQSEKFTFQMTNEELSQLKETQTKALLSAFSQVTAYDSDMLILDECLGALSTNTLDYEILKQQVLNKPEHLELVLTGRNPDEWLLSIADYVSEIQAVKHPYEKGVSARKGIEM